VFCFCVVAKLFFVRLTRGRWYTICIIKGVFLGVGGLLMMVLDIMMRNLFLFDCTIGAGKTACVVCMCV